MARENLQVNVLSPVTLICVSCSRQQIVHIPEWRCFTKEIHMVCLECQESGSVFGKAPAGTLGTLHLADRNGKGGRRS